MKQNPHEKSLNNVFDLAGINYGRIDYSILHGKPVVWEINTNPHFGPRISSFPYLCTSSTKHPLVLAEYDNFHRKFLEALTDLNKTGNSEKEHPLSIVDISSLSLSFKSLTPSLYSILLRQFHMFLESEYTRFPRFQRFCHTMAKRFAKQDIS
jgi:hypothetical protein